jgi:two-component system cell cycle sensor histidine kinase/response regulator CckA
LSAFASPPQTGTTSFLANLNATQNGSSPIAGAATLESIFRAAPVGICVVTHGVFTHVNSRLCEMAGYSRNELIDQPEKILFASETDLDLVRINQFDDIRLQGPRTIETRWRRKDGKLIDVLLGFSRINLAGASAGVTFTALDITESRQAERELRWRNRQLAGLQKISEVTLSGENEQHIFDTIAREAAGMTDFPMVAIELCDFEKSEMIFRGVYGMKLEGMPVPFEVPMDVTLSGEVARTGKILVETQARSRREYAAPFLRRLNVQTFLCVPIKINDRVIGTLSLAHGEKISVEERVISQAASLANHLATLFDRLQAREAVRRGEAELAAVYDRAPNVMCLFDDTFRIVRANRAAAELANCQKEDLVGLGVGDFLRCPACAENRVACGTKAGCSGSDLRRAVNETFISGKSWQRVRVHTQLPRDGQVEEIVLLVSTERIQVDGLMRVLMCLENITQSVRADEQIRAQAALLDITRDAIFVRDFSDRITYWNDGAQRLYGWAATEVKGRTTSELNLTVDQAECAQAIMAVQKDEEWIGEMKHRTRDGRELIVQSRWTLVRDRNGAGKAILIVSTDITEKKRLEAQLYRSQRLESIGTLASGLAHDLNNVLAPIMMAVHFLKEEAKDERTRTWVQTLESCSQRGASIVRQVLMFARGVEGTRGLLQPKHIVTEIERIARETFPRSIHIQTRICRNPPLFNGDSTQIQQVLLNLCVNARDAMPNGGTLAISVEPAELQGEAVRINPKAKPGPYVVISVADTGTGIAPELMDKIFDPFFTTKPIGHGTGLGLPTVLGIVQGHQGFVQVESIVGKGSTFQIYLPAAPVENEMLPSEASIASLPKGNGELILVVDDEPAIGQIASVILRGNGYRTLVAADGYEALALFRENRDAVKLVVADLMMPRLDGPTTIRELRRMQPDIPTITITGLGEEGRIAEAKAAGTNAVINKPFTAEQLLAAIQPLLKH